MVYRIIILLIMLTAYACRNNPVNNEDSTTLGRNDMEDLNIYFVKKDRERIQNYIERRNLQMKESPTGLWFQIIKQGEGDHFKENDRVFFEYECSLLDGSRCYSSAESGAKEVILGRSEMEAGLNEGFRMLKPGGEAIFILPPYLAFGLIGDRKKIPPRAVVIYYVKILSDNK
jgi:FKBP-type peptidyl-prolyl cis-trans isomerase FkpA